MGFSLSPPSVDFQDFFLRMYMHTLIRRTGITVHASMQIHAFFLVTFLVDISTPRGGIMIRRRWFFLVVFWWLFFFFGHCHFADNQPTLEVSHATSLTLYTLYTPSHNSHTTVRESCECTSRTPKLGKQHLLLLSVGKKGTPPPPFTRQREGYVTRLGRCRGRGEEGPSYGLAHSYLTSTPSSRSEVGKKDGERIVVARGGRFRVVAGICVLGKYLRAAHARCLLPRSVQYTIPVRTIPYAHTLAFLHTYSSTCS